MSLLFDDFVLASMICVLGVNSYDIIFFFLDFPSGSVVKNKNPPMMQEPQKSWGILGWEDPLEEKMATHCSILAGKCHGQRSLVDCLWGCKESDRTEHACIVFFPVQTPSMVIFFV